MLNQPSTFDFSVLTEIPQWPVSENLADTPSLCEVHHAMMMMMMMMKLPILPCAEKLELVLSTAPKT